jgi:hypothetical protein
MSLSDLASIGTLISSFAVLGSLIYLGLQMRQNARHTRALIHQGRVARIIDTQLHAAEPSQAAAFIAGNGGEPTEAAIRRRAFECYCGAAFISLEDSFDQRSDGLLSDAQFEGFRRGVGWVMSDAGVRVRWQTMRPGYGASPFAVFVDEVIAKLPAAPDAPSP